MAMEQKHQMKKTRSKPSDNRSTGRPGSGTKHGELRGQVERHLSKKKTAMPEQDAQKMLHELEVHQIELEMQNEELRRAQGTIVESQQRYADLNDIAPVGYVTLNSMGLITEVNLTGTSLLGVERGQLQNKFFSFFVASESRDTFHRHYRGVLKTGTPGTCEVQLTRNNGTSFYASLHSVPVPDIEGNLTRVRSIIRDITERKQADAAAAEAQAIITALVENTEDMIWSVDPERFGLLTFNSALKNYFFDNLGLDLRLGMTPDDMITRSFTPAVAEKWHQLYLRALREGPFTEEYGVSSAPRVLLLSLNLLRREEGVFGISVFGRDITERKRAVQALQTSEEKFRQFFKNTPDYCYIVSPEGTILNVSDAVVRTLGYTREELVGEPLTMVYAPESRAKMKELFSEWKERGEIRNEEMVIITRKGEKRTVLLNAGAVRDQAGKLLHSTSVQTDITERKKAEAEAFAARRELLRTERLLRMGELTASLAHELNQPLTAILSNAHAALRFLDAGKLSMDQLREILQDIAHDDKRAGDIIRSLRSMVKPEEGYQELISVNDVLTEVSSLFNSEAIIRNIKVEMNCVNSLPPVTINKIQIQQVLINLMMNAAESMLDVPGERKIILQTQATNGGGVQVAVRDFGPGIEEEDIGKLFEPFFTTKRSGLGMGLSLSRSIIEAHGGHIWVKNNPDRGATFYFDLPGASAT
jgi:PAS domain S-box-containing protein